MKKQFWKTFGNQELMQAWAIPRLNFSNVESYVLKYYTSKSMKEGHTFYHLEGWYIPKKKGGKS